MRIRRVALRWLAPGCLVLVLVANACSSLETAGPGTARPADDVAVRDDAVVYVVERGWHTDIAVPVKAITGKLATLETVFPGVRVLTFGFGERQFLVNREANFGSMLKALLPSQSALLVTALRASPEDAFGASNVTVLHVSQAGLERIEARIWNAFEQPASGELRPLAEGPYPGSLFYAANGTYDLLYTCNTWTAETLRVGGVQMTVAGVVFSGQVMGMARWIAAHHASSP